MRAVVPEPLEVSDPIVKFEFIRLPVTTGFGDFTECGQMIPVRFRGESGIFVHSMYLDDEAPIAGGREIWGFRRNWRGQYFAMRARCLSARCIFGSVLCAVGSMGYKHQELDPAPILRELGEPNFLIKIIPHVDGKARICELVRYRWRDGALKGACGGPVALQLFAHAMGNVSKLPVLEVLSGTHFVADVTLGLGEVVHDFLAAAKRRQFAAFPSRRNPRNERNASAACKGTRGQFEAIALRYDRVALVLQGGGALGAYQIGVYQALAEAGCEPKTIFGRRTVPTSPENNRVDYELLLAGRA